MRKGLLEFTSSPLFIVVYIYQLMPTLTVVVWVAAVQILLNKSVYIVQIDSSVG